MPYTNLPEADWPKMDRCVKDLKEQGYDEQSAIAICYTSISGNAGKAQKYAEELAVKIGARHSRADSETLQAMHDYAVKLGAVCGDAKALASVKSLPLKFLGETSDGELRFGEYAALWGSPIKTDISPYRDFFRPETDFGARNGEGVDLTFHHGLPLVDAKGMLLMDNPFGTDSIGVTIKAYKDNIGLFIESVTKMRREYREATKHLIKCGELSYSTGAVGHTVERELQPNGSNFIKRWWIGELALTPTQAEPRLAAVSLKSLLSRTASPEGGSTASAKPRRVTRTTKG